MKITMRNNNNSRINLNHLNATNNWAMCIFCPFFLITHSSSDNRDWPITGELRMQLPKRLEWIKKSTNTFVDYCQDKKKLIWHVDEVWNQPFLSDTIYILYMTAITFEMLLYCIDNNIIRTVKKIEVVAVVCFCYLLTNCHFWWDFIQGIRFEALFLF